MDGLRSYLHVREEPKRSEEVSVEKKNGKNEMKKKKNKTRQRNEDAPRDFLRERALHELEADRIHLVLDRDRQEGVVQKYADGGDHSEAGERDRRVDGALPLQIAALRVEIRGDEAKDEPVEKDRGGRFERAAENREAGEAHVVRLAVRAERALWRRRGRRGEAAVAAERVRHAERVRRRDGRREPRVRIVELFALLAAALLLAPFRRARALRLLRRRRRRRRLLRGERRGIRALLR